MSLNCPKCGLPIFDGTAGYVGPQCMCQYRQYATTHFADDATLARIAALERDNAELKQLWFSDADPRETLYAAEYAAFAKIKEAS